jgi:flagellar biosynthesis component FlhA
VITTVAICLAILLAVPLMAFAMIFAVGCACGVAAYHLSRQVVVSYQPMRKAFDPNKEKSRAIAAAQKMAQEAADIQREYIGGLQLTRESFVAGENGK